MVYLLAFLLLFQSLGADCQLDRAVSAARFDWSDWSTTELDEADMLALAGWSGVSIWTMEGDYGYFDMPDGLVPRWTYTVLLDDGSEKRIDVFVDGGTWYVFGFNSLVLSTDRNGEHYGAHDLCAYFEMEMSDALRDP